MMRTCTTGIVAALFAMNVLFLAAVGQAQGQVSAARPGNPLNAISWMLGTWTAVEQGPDGLALTIQFDAQWSANHKAIQVTATRIPAEGSPALEYRASYRWDSDKAQIVMTRTDSNGGHFLGVVEPAGNSFSLAGRLTRANGSIEQLRYAYNSWTPGTFALETTSQEQRLLDTAVNPSLVFLRQKPPPNSGKTEGTERESFSGITDTPSPFGRKTCSKALNPAGFASAGWKHKTESIAT